VTPEALVHAVLEWLKEQQATEPMDEAVIAELGPPLVGWAMAIHFPPPLGQLPRERSSVASSRWSKLKGKLARATTAAPANPARTTGSPEPPARLLAICMQVNAARAFVPVARELRTRGVETNFLVERGDTATQLLLESEAFPVRASASLLDPRVLSGIALGTARLRPLWTSASVRDLLTRLALPHTDALTQSLGTRIRKSVLGGLVRGETALSALLESPADNVLFVTRRALFNALLLHTHPVAGRFFFLQGIVPEVPPISTKLDVHRAFAGGPIDLPYLRRCGIPDSCISLCGYPDYDAFAGLNKATCRAEFANNRRINPNRRWILFTSQYETALFSNAARLANLAALVEVASQATDSEFIVKLHPRNETWNAPNLPGNVFLETTYSTPQLIKAADLVVTYWSTTAIEALLLKTPLVQLNATGLLDFLPLPPGLCVPVARSSSELKTCLNAPGAAAARPSAETLERWLGPPPDGKAAERAAHALAQALR
jgi:hypothetical protein